MPWSERMMFTEMLNREFSGASDEDGNDALDLDEENGPTRVVKTDDLSSLGLVAHEIS